MKIDIKIDEFHLELNKDILKKELRLIAKEVKQKTIALLKNSVPSGKKRGSHTASAPGQAPSLMDGLLASSITYKIKKDRIVIKDSAYYSLFLEAGATKTGKSGTGTILPRPFLSTVLDEMRPDIEKRLEKAVMQGLTSKP